MAVSSARRLATLLPVMLCALWSLLLVPVSGAPAPGPSAVGAAPARGLPHGSADHRTGPHAVPRATAQEQQLAAVAVVGLPAAVEHPSRFPAAPGAPAGALPDLSAPARGLLAGDPRRERAPPGDPHGPHAPRGPPSTRHS